MRSMPIGGAWLGLFAAMLSVAACNSEARDEDRDGADVRADDVDEPIAKSAAQSSDEMAHLDGARALVAEIYDAYVNDEMAQGEFMSPDLLRVIQNPASGMWDEDMGLGFDPFCACQDFGEVSYEITRLEPAGEDRAQAEVSLTSLGERRAIRLDLVNVTGDPVVEGWRVDDVAVDGEPSLRETAGEVALIPSAFTARSTTPFPVTSWR